jgi:hypothetical protein
VVYGRKPSLLRAYSSGEARLPAVDAQLKERNEFLGEIRDRPMDYEVGQWVWLWLLHRSMASLEVKGCGKLGPHYFGSFQITEKIGTVVYRLRLSALHSRRVPRWAPKEVLQRAASSTTGAASST